MVLSRTASSVALTVSSKLTAKLIDFLVLLLLARILGPEDFGLIAVAMILISIIETISELPIGSALICLPNVTRRHIDTAFTINLLRSVSLGLLIATLSFPFAALYHLPNLGPVILALSFASVARGLMSPFISICIKELNFTPVFLSETAGKLSGGIAGVASAYLGGGVWSIVIASVTTPTATTLLSYAFAPYRPNFSLREYKYFLSFAGWLSMSKIFTAVSWQFDRLLLGRYVDPVQFGRYTMASDLAALPAQSLILPTIVPIMASFSQLSHDENRLRAYYEKCIFAVTLVGIPIFLGLSAAAFPLVNALLGEKWQASVYYLKLIAFEPIFYLFTQPLPALAAALRQTKTMFHLALIEFTFKLPLVSLGLLVDGVQGVIIARLLCSALLNVIYMNYVKSILGLSRIRQIGSARIPVMAGVVMYLVEIFIQDKIAALFQNPYATACSAVFIGALVYAIVLYSLGVNLKKAREIFIIDKKL